MSCYHPLEALMSFDEDTQKNRLFFYKPSLDPSSVYQNVRSGNIPDGCEVVNIPCGQCVGCRLEYSRQWAIRCMLESKAHNDNYFLTLTYNDEHLPLSVGEDGVTRMTLEKDAVSSFMKRLRRHFEYHKAVTNIRFFGVGEYGSKSNRPHYHILVFGLPLDDLELHSLNDGNPLFRSRTLERLWSKKVDKDSDEYVPLGFVSVGSLSFQSAAYVARYSLKKEKGRHAEKYYRSLGIEPEYVRMSRRPGIAREYYDENSEKIYRYDELIISNSDGVARVKPVKYYDRLFRANHEADYKVLADARRDSAERAFAVEMSRTSVDDRWTYLETKEGNKLFAVKSLVRDL